MRTSYIMLKGLKKTFAQGEKEIIVLNNISESFYKGKTYAITGASGSGKSTLLHIIAGLDTPTQGEVVIDKQNLASFSPSQKEQWLNTSLGLVFQYPYLIKELSIVYNVMLKGLIAGLSHAACEKKAKQLLKLVGLYEKKDEFPPVLSGGQKQRIALARALFNEPDLLIADEPTGNLDDKTGKEIIDLLLECQKKWDMGLIISSHDAYVAENMGKVFDLKDGQLTLTKE